MFVMNGAESRQDWQQFRYLFPVTGPSQQKSAGPRCGGAGAQQGGQQEPQPGVKTAASPLDAKGRVHGAEHFQRLPFQYSPLRAGELRLDHQISRLIVAVIRFFHLDDLSADASYHVRIPPYVPEKSEIHFRFPLDSSLGGLWKFIQIYGLLFFCPFIFLGLFSEQTDKKSELEKIWFC